MSRWASISSRDLTTYGRLPEHGGQLEGAVATGEAAEGLLADRGSDPKPSLGPGTLQRGDRGGYSRRITNVDADPGPELSNDSLGAAAVGREVDLGG